ncbi:keratin-associated protein 10-2-like [Physella acuta]|uniref:keratin-associated protein 10-2-like n=1 Tax=Physella acuta TaxID=109671 RepID=UPI0027DC2EA2|nr:keratin-associated protein 10-2-like [Physella acuta]
MKLEVPLPLIDGCGGCPTGQECVSTGIVCKKAPCPSFQCVERPKYKVVNSCYECSPYEKCIPTGVVCITTPCPSFTCVSIPPRPPVACNLNCRRGYTCVLREPTCTRRNCNRRPVPTCVPEIPQLATCPKPPQIFTLNDLVCRIRNINRGCQSDAECDSSVNQRCCLDLCNRMVCITVPRLSV